MDLIQLYFLALFATVLTSIGMAGVLRFKVENRPGLRPLILFCLGVAFWVSGHLLINFGTAYELDLGLALINASPMVPAFFVHFALAFIGSQKKKLIYLNYAVASAASLAGVLLLAGRIRPWAGFERFYQFDDIAMGVAIITAAFSVFGHLCLLHGRKKAENKKLNQINAVFLAGVWGFASASGFLFGSLNLDIFPFPVIFLPFYTVFLVYGVLRYELMDINIWARKSLTWGLLAATLVLLTGLVFAGLAKMGISELTQVPVWQIWLLCIVIVSLTMLLQKPAVEAATRLIYPGSRLTSSVINRWQTKLDGIQSWKELSTKATSLLGEHLGFTVEVKAAPSDPEPYSYKPTLVCEKERLGWHCKMSGWEKATPGIIRTVEVFGSVLVSSAKKLEDAYILAEKEKELLKQNHLAELGRLSATVAHELRNPLNIISMASAACEDGIKKEINLQLARAQQLTSDLLTYSGNINLEKKSINLRDECEYMLSHYRKTGIDLRVEIPADMTLSADPHRVHQVFFNLIDNAIAVLKGREDAKLMLHASRSPGGISVVIADNGPGVSPKIMADLFKPFISGRQGGNGLGLAIVRRIMEAHGGRIDLIRREGWSCCFELYFPTEG